MAVGELGIAWHFIVLCGLHDGIVWYFMVQTCIDSVELGLKKNLTPQYFLCQMVEIESPPICLQGLPF